MKLYQKRGRGSDMVTATEIAEFVYCPEQWRLQEGRTRHQVDNTAELRAWVLDIAAQIRAARARVGEPIAVNPRPGQCRRCGMLEHCGQARL
jgi:CRISPR/Cas system-associated exonuclease Cas4 (RecB family)